MKRIKDAGVKLSAKGRKRVELDPSFANAMITRRRNRLAWKTLATRDESDQENYDRAQEILETKTRLKKTSIGFVNETIPDDQSASVDARLEKVVKQAAQSIDELTKLPKEIITDRETDEILASIVNDKVSEKHKDSFVDHIRSVPVPTLAAVPDDCDHSDQMILFRGYENHVQVCRAFVRDPNKYSSFPISWMTFYRLACRIFEACAKHEPLPNENTHDLSKMYRRYIGSEFILRGDNDPYLHVRTENDGLTRVAMCWADIDDLGRGLIRAASIAKGVWDPIDESEILRKQNEGRKADIERMHKEYGEIYKRCQAAEARQEELQQCINKYEAQRKMDMGQLSEALYGAATIEEMLRCINSLRNEVRTLSFNADQKIKDLQAHYSDLVDAITKHGKPSPVFADIFHDQHLQKARDAGEALDRVKHLEAQIDNVASALGWKSEASKLTPDEIRIELTARIQKMKEILGERRMADYEASLQAERSKLEKREKQYRDLVAASYGGKGCSNNAIDTFHSMFVQHATALYTYASEGEDSPKLKELSGLWDQVREAIEMLDDDGEAIVRRVQHLQKSYGEFNAQTVTLGKREHQYRELVSALYQDNEAARSDIDEQHETHLSEMHRVMREHPLYPTALDCLKQIADALGWMWSGEAVSLKRSCKELLSFVKVIAEKRDEEIKEIHDLREQLKSQTDTPTQESDRLICTIEEAVDRFTLEEIADLISERINTRLFQREQMRIDNDCTSDVDYDLVDWVVWVVRANISTAYVFGDLKIELHSRKGITDTEFLFWIHVIGKDLRAVLPKHYKTESAAKEAAEKLYHVLRSIQA